MSDKYLFAGRPIIDTIVERTRSLLTLSNSLRNDLSNDNDAQAEETLHLFLSDCLADANAAETLLEQLQARPGRLPGNPRDIGSGPPAAAPCPQSDQPAPPCPPRPPADAKALLDRYRAPMVRRLANVTAESQGDAALRQFCERVLDDLDQIHHDSPAKRDYLPGEEVFLWSHNELMELADIANPAPPDDPYLRDMLARLRDFAGRLARNEPLPPGFAIHWLDDDLEDDDLDPALPGLAGDPR